MHTVDTIMAKIAKLRIHIAPVGYEIDRIVLPAKQERADKVWLLLHENKSDDKAGPFISKITKAHHAEEKYEQEHVELEPVSVEAIEDEQEDIGYGQTDNSAEYVEKFVNTFLGMVTI